MISKEIMSRIASARENGEFTDFSFTCQGQTIPVHRIIICTQSPVFHAACTGQFMEASSRTYCLDSHSLSDVLRMVEYLYTGDYTVDSDEVASDKSTTSILSLHAIMFALAHEYDISGLEYLAADKYSNSLETNSDFCTFLLSIPHVYDLTPSTSRGLRDRALAFARLKVSVFLRSPDAQKLFDEMTAGSPDFIRELLHSFIQSPLLGDCSTCGSAVPMTPTQQRCKKCNRGGAFAIRF
ncbi:BTB/POZ protein [Mariannaea sp. PMI_226]|nr:BTB/POZ protein [Mariannaea sp. PMI_226]